MAEFVQFVQKLPRPEDGQEHLYGFGEVLHMSPPYAEAASNFASTASDCFFFRVAVDSFGDGRAAVAGAG